ncbi:MAG: LysR family transcriptional regulator [Lachnospiraceae bacterium]|nr:LysR family transcriptional regulator [Lachnospiraceae bacterium]
MTLKQLETFKLISENLSFTKTAKVLDIAQSAVTTQIKGLEKELGVKLFERIGSNVSLTHEGEKLLLHANRMLETKNDILNLYSSDNDKQGNSIVIGISEILCQLYLPDILREFLAHYPNTKITVKMLSDITETDVNSAVSPYKLLENNEIDIAFVMSSAKNVNRSFLVHSTEKIGISLLSSFHQDFSYGRSLSANEISKLPFLLPQKNCCYRTLFEQMAARQGGRIHVALESNSISVLKENAASGIGLCLIPEMAASKELMVHSLNRVNIDMNLKVYSVLMTHKNKWMSEELSGFIEIACEKM